MIQQKLLGVLNSLQEKWEDILNHSNSINWIQRQKNRQNPAPVKLRFNPMMYNRSKVSSFGLQKDQRSQNKNLKSNKTYGRLGNFRRTSSINEILSDDSEVMADSSNPSSKMPRVEIKMNLNSTKNASLIKTRNQTFNTDRSQ